MVNCLRPWPDVTGLDMNTRGRNIKTGVNIPSLIHPLRLLSDYSAEADKLKSLTDFVLRQSSKDNNCFTLQVGIVKWSQDYSAVFSLKLL